MDNSTRDTELLVRYLDNELAAGEKSALEQRLEESAALREELESLRLAREAVRRFGLSRQVKTVHEQMKKELRPVRKMTRGRKFARYSLAVAASLLIVVIGVLGYNFYTLSPARVYASNFRSYELATMRDPGAPSTPIETAYRERDFQKLVRAGKDEKSLSPREQFLVAMAHTELKNYSAAIDEFKKLTARGGESGAAAVMPETGYYLALVYVRNKDYDLALELLHKIHDDPSHPYHARVSGKLIRQVKMLKWR